MEWMLKGSLQSAMKEMKSAWKKQQGTLNIYIHESGSSPADKNLGVGVLDMIWQCACAAQKPKRILGCIKRNVATGGGGGFSPSTPFS